MKKEYIMAFAFAVALMSVVSVQSVQAVPFNVTVRFWNDQNMNTPYTNSFMKVYFQNKSYVGGFTNQYICYHADYINGSALISVNTTNPVDLLITDGNLQWNNVTGCPNIVENYAFWATVQSGMVIDHDQTLDYWINVTYTANQPRSTFWNTQSLRSLIAVLYWVAVLVIIIVLEWYLTKGGGSPSWLLPLIIFVIAVIVKLATGI